MNKKTRNRVLAGVVLVSLLIVFTSGCDKYTKHEVLTFFFTGVPPLEGEEGVEEVEGTKEVKKMERVRKKKKYVLEATYFMHGPNAARQCYQCHVITPAFSFSKTGKRRAGGIPRLGGQTTGMYVVPLKELCLECHPPKSARAAHWSDDGPVSEGNCTFCHDPHKSPYRYMLRKKF